MGNHGNSERLYFLELQKSLQMENAAMKLKDVYSMKEKHIYKNLCTNAHSSIIHNGLKAETTQMSISDIATQWI